MKKLTALILALIISALSAISVSAVAAPGTKACRRSALPVPGAAVLSVTDKGTGRPVAGAAYELYRMNPFGGKDTKVTAARTDTDGRITVSHVTPGRYYWAAAAQIEGYAADEEKHAFAVIGAKSVTVEIALSEPAGPAPLFTEVSAEWFAAYLDVIIQFALQNPDARFGFIHVDGDDVPELVCSSRAPETILPIDRTVEWIYLYTIRGGKAELDGFCATGPLEYIARTGHYRYIHEYAAFGPTRYIYTSLGGSPGERMNYGYGPLEVDGDVVSVIGFCEPDPETGGWMEREISREEYEELLKVCFPVTAETSGETEVAGAVYTITYDVLVPMEELTIR